MFFVFLVILLHFKNMNQLSLSTAWASPSLQCLGPGAHYLQSSEHNSDRHSDTDRHSLDQISETDQIQIHIAQ